MGHEKDYGILKDPSDPNSEMIRFDKAILLCENSALVEGMQTVSKYEPRTTITLYHRKFSRLFKGEGKHSLPNYEKMANRLAFFYKSLKNEIYDKDQLVGMISNIHAKKHKGKVDASIALFINYDMDNVGTYVQYLVQWGYAEEGDIEKPIESLKNTVPSGPNVGGGDYDFDLLDMIDDDLPQDMDGLKDVRWRRMGREKKDEEDPEEEMIEDLEEE